MEITKYNNIDEYIANFPENIQTMLQEVRITIKKTTPTSIEAISY
jgi:uncharacterized protein YdhG (YjbR/CyaY superfamily)